METVKTMDGQNLPDKGQEVFLTACQVMQNIELN
jgi:hypothetical protein